MGYGEGPLDFLEGVTAMPIKMPPLLRPVLKPVFAALPLGDAMRALVVDAPLRGAAHDAVAAAVGDDAIAASPELVAGLWLYVDDLDRSHSVAQSLHSPTGSFWHAVMHRREGDFSNAQYWYRKAGIHPAMNHIDLTGGGAGSGTDVARYDPIAFTGQVQRACERGDPRNPALVSEQAKEWKALFEWCVAHCD